MKGSTLTEQTLTPPPHNLNPHITPPKQVAAGEAL